MYEGITFVESSTAYEDITYQGITPLRLRKSSTALSCLHESSIAYEGITFAESSTAYREKVMNRKGA